MAGDGTFDPGPVKMSLLHHCTEAIITHLVSFKDAAELPQCHLRKITSQSQFAMKQRRPLLIALATHTLIIIQYSVSVDFPESNIQLVVQMRVMEL